MKKTLIYNYKKGSSRPLIRKSETLKYLQSIYSWRILEDMRSDRVLVNVDESSYSRSIKTNYTWLPIGSAHPVLNINWTGRISVIFGLISNGDWIWMTAGGTTKTFDYWIFLMLLSKYIKILFRGQATSIKLLVDNASIHVSSKSKLICSHYGFEINTLPPYSPNLAPVELVFALSKKSVCKELTKKKLNFDKPIERAVVHNSFRKISKKEGLEIWRKFINEAKSCIFNAMKDCDENDFALIQRRDDIEYVHFS